MMLFLYASCSAVTRYVMLRVTWSCIARRFVTCGCTAVVSEQVYKGLKDYTRPREEVPAAVPPGCRAFGG